MRKPAVEAGIESEEMGYSVSIGQGNEPRIVRGAAPDFKLLAYG